MKIVYCLTIAVAALAISSRLSANEIPSLDRLIAEAESRDEWKSAAAITDRLWLIREAALARDTVSDPVSDRYLITALAGPIDIVHFFGLAVPVASGKQTRDEALLFHWKDEGGLDHENGTRFSSPPEAHPDDLPSNALGALFGEEIRARNGDLDFDVVTALREFLLPLEPVSDEIAKKFSHRTIVMGLKESSSREMVNSRSEWFTAVPLFSLFAFDRERAQTFGSPEAALAAAGFEVIELEGRPIKIERIK
ncbi:MAG: hypothetical protein AAGF67_12505 [Verrucomicrobiota bacterium]